MSIVCKSVSVHLGGKDIVKGLNTEFKEGSFVGIIGPNGSGKSTFLKTIYRTLNASAGEILLDDKALTSYNYKDSAKKMAVVAQHSDYNFDFNCLEVVLMGRSPHKKYMQPDNEEDYKIAYDALEKVEMRDYVDRDFSTLSGGEQQRVILARALCQKTPYLILDEPTNHLDIRHQLDILDLVKKLDVTIIAALHDLNIAYKYCDYLYILKAGNLCYQGKPDEVLTPEIIAEIYDVQCNILEDNLNNTKVISFY